MFFMSTLCYLKQVRVFLNNTFENKLRLGNTEKQSIRYMKEHAPEFSSYEEFIRNCFDEKEK